MKMENIIKAPIDGKVKDILVEEGNTVAKKQLLIELE
jgi:biotin carboxyl carrier protein